MSFIQLNRAPEVNELLENDPNSFLLLTQIALRARRTTSGLNRHNLNPGEALIGDYEKAGLTEQKYRTAKKRLEQYGLATFKPTSKGTVATLCNTVIYDINIDSDNGQDNDLPTGGQRSSNGQPTTNNNDNKPNKEKEDTYISREANDEIEHPYKKQKISHPESVDEVIDYGKEKGIPEVCCEIYYDMRARDNFMRSDRQGNPISIHNWFNDLSFLYRKGALEPKKQSKNERTFDNYQQKKRESDEFLDKYYQESRQ